MVDSFFNILVLEMVMRWNGLEEVLAIEEKWFWSSWMRLEGIKWRIWWEVVVWIEGSTLSGLLTCSMKMKLDQSQVIMILYDRKNDFVDIWCRKINRWKEKNRMVKVRHHSLFSGLFDEDETGTIFDYYGSIRLEEWFCRYMMLENQSVEGENSMVKVGHHSLFWSLFIFPSLLAFKHLEVSSSPLHHQLGFCNIILT